MLGWYTIKILNIDRVMINKELTPDQQSVENNEIFMRDIG